jgi:hypothetical protein
MKIIALLLCAASLVLTGCANNPAVDQNTATLHGDAGGRNA